MRAGSASEACGLWNHTCSIAMDSWLFPVVVARCDAVGGLLRVRCARHQPFAPRSVCLREHDPAFAGASLFRKPEPTFRDHALMSVLALPSSLSDLGLDLCRPIALARLG